MKDIKTTLEERGYVATDLGAGAHAMIKEFPCGVTVWVYDNQGSVNFDVSSATVYVGVYDQGSSMRPVDEVPRDQFAETLHRNEVFAYQEGSVRLNEDDLVEEAFNEAVAVIQQKLGVKDGGFAGIYFSGELEDQLKELLYGYLQAELKFNEPEATLTWDVTLTLENKAEFKWSGEAEDKKHAEGLAIADATAKTGEQVLEVVSVAAQQ